MWGPDTTWPSLSSHRPAFWGAEANPFVTAEESGTLGVCPSPRAASSLLSVLRPPASEVPAEGLTGPAVHTLVFCFC